MGKGREVSPVLAGIVIVIVILVLGLFIWKETNTSTGVSGVGATSAALPHNGKPPVMPMPAKPMGASRSNIPMPGKTPVIPSAGR